jgi:predicted DCC family thiol-disulfide oxidoreductase YuxK
LVFDGDCGFCTSSAGWLVRGWHDGPTAVAWQQLGPDGLATIGLSVEDAGQAAWWVDDEGQLFRGHRAMAKALLASSGLRRAAGAVINVPPLKWAAAAAYRLVVKYRYRLPGGTAACRTGQPRAW